MVLIKKNEQKVWVTFTYSPKTAVHNVAISGEWNEWKEEPMKLKKNGDFYITKMFKSGECFEFGYKLNGENWVTEEQCITKASPYASQNSVLVL